MSIGPDVASADGLGLNPDWQKCQRDGHAEFVGLRASYGSAPDSKYAAYATQLGKLGIPYFGYLFLRFGDNVGTPEAQADTALGMIGTPNQNYFVPVVDLEFGGKRPTGWSVQQTLDWFLRAWRRMKSALGADPGIYTSEVVWVDPDQMGNPTCPEIMNAWSWTKYWPFPTRSPAVYDPATVNALHEPKVAPPFDGAWPVQQYQGDALHYTGLIGTCDLNRVNVVKKGDKNGTVRYIQRKLKVTPIDGDFGVQTELAVKAFQAVNGLVADGVVGLKTHMRLSWIR